MRILRGNTPRWIVFSLDVFTAAVSILLAYLLRFNFHIPEPDLSFFPYVFCFVVTFRAISFYLGKTYQGIIRYTSFDDARRIFTVIFFGSLSFGIVNAFSFNAITKFVIPFSIIIIDFMTTIFTMVSLRVLFKVMYFEMKNPRREKNKVIIYGAGDEGIFTKRALERDAGTRYRVAAFIDDNKSRIGKKIESVKIYGVDEFENLIAEKKISQLIFSNSKVLATHKQDLVDKCFLHNIKVLNVPPITNWINGELSFKQIKKIKIEDLLERDEIILDTVKINQQLQNKTVLITGAAGSIGSEIVRQVNKFNPKKLILFDIAESPLYDLEMEFADKAGKHNIEVVIGDIRNEHRMRNVFDTFRPSVVFHAAAYKHVPMMENNPSEAINTNVLGTKIIADLSNEFGVENFVMVSTDKAVNPTNVMGASKRAAEIYIQALNKKSKTKFITTRFGNVLGSNGSVIPRFKKQIESGGPITITHPEITRFFMTIPEACQLVLEAGSMGNGGEVFVFDMGKSVKIIDLAKKMIRLSGLTLNKDIQIVTTGLRPGEKLYEELLNDGENTIPTHHKQIMIGKVIEYDFEVIDKHINEVIALFDAQENFRIVAKLKQIVPEYVSNNSVFEKLDNITS
jgi:FlaA1/EpsC-like NDP-sugar epimerase